MDRKDFLTGITASITGLMTFPALLYSNSYLKRDEWSRIISRDVNFPDLTYPEDKRIPLGWDVFPVQANGMFHKETKTTLLFPEANHITEEAWLRITAAIDIREKILITVQLAESGSQIGEFDIKYAHPFQPFQIPLDPLTMKEVSREGVSLKMIKGSHDAWFFQPDSNRAYNEGLQPQIITGQSTNPKAEFRKNLMSMNSFSPFGWMGGCVNDALYVMAKDGDMQAMKTLKEQLGMYLDYDNGVIFENPRSETLLGTFNSIEDFLPFAAISGLYPDHPSIKMALNFLMSRERDDGLIATGSITTEGCYTVAYPLAAIAVVRNDSHLARKALTQIRFRTHYLTNEKSIFQRSSQDGEQSFENWGRGVTWYLLGIAKTLEILRHGNFDRFDELPEIEREFQRAIEQVAKLQNKSGLWYSFLDREDTNIDTSASAGIAAAILIGINLGLVNSTYQTSVAKTYQSLLNYITPDGFLTHISQINRGGEELQAGGYRVISQFGIGLLAQLEHYLKTS